MAFDSLLKKSHPPINANCVSTTTTAEVVALKGRPQIVVAVVLVLPQLDIQENIAATGIRGLARKESMLQDGVHIAKPSAMMQFGIVPRCGFLPLNKLRSRFNDRMALDRL